MKKSRKEPLAQVIWRERPIIAQAVEEDRLRKARKAKKIHELITALYSFRTWNVKEDSDLWTEIDHMIDTIEADPGVTFAGTSQAIIENALIWWRSI